MGKLLTVFFCRLATLICPDVIDTYLDLDLDHGLDQDDLDLSSHLFCHLDLFGSYSYDQTGYDLFLAI